VRHLDLENNEHDIEGGRAMNGNNANNANNANNGSNANNANNTIVAVFGGTGGVGVQLIKQTLEAGYRVRTLVRRPEKLEATIDGLSATARARLTVVEGDIFDASAVRQVLNGSQAVFCALGAPARNKDRIRTRGTAVIIEQMKTLGIERIIAVSVYGAAETRADLPFFIKRILFPFYLSRAVADHEAQERLLAASGLQWTAVRPPHLDNSDKGRPIVHGSLLDGRSMHISRKALASFMLEELAAQRYVCATPAVSQVSA
jgi:uncharacterized protein YbjT (DUF2867 family)